MTSSGFSVGPTDKGKNASMSNMGLNSSEGTKRNENPKDNTWRTGLGKSNIQVNEDSESEVEEVYDETAHFMALKIRKKGVEFLELHAYHHHMGRIHHPQLYPSIFLTIFSDHIQLPLMLKKHAVSV
ncbi:hypothetical protein Tco_1530645 [Tanacetum coccineum]